MNTAGTAHFTEVELACPHCRMNFCVRRTYDMLEEFRLKAGAPVIVDSGYRCPTHNLAVNGAQRSQHVFGTAADVRIPGLTGAQLQAIAERCSLITGMGRNDHEDWLHIDCRQGDPVRWCYNPARQPCAYYAPGTGLEERA